MRVMRGRGRCWCNLYVHDTSRGDVDVGASTVARAAAAALEPRPEATLSSSMVGWRRPSRRGGEALLHDTNAHFLVFGLRVQRK
jgi:hypothetical protein